MDQFVQRESFAIQSAIVINELQQMIEKTKKIEVQLKKEASPQVVHDEFYRPSSETQDMQPLRKRIKLGN
jgi:hypothetical protein